MEKVLSNAAARWHDSGVKLIPRRESVIAIALTSSVAVVAVLWVMSYWHSFAIGWMRSRDHANEWEQTFWGVYMQRGQVGAGRSRSQADSPQLLPTRLAHKDWYDEHELIVRAYYTAGGPWMSWDGTTTPDTVLGRTGFEVIHSTTRWPGTVRTDRAALLPWWAVFVVTLAITLRWTFFRERRLYWPKIGRCAACGYDLRESRDRCPECGQPIGAQPI